MVKNGMNLLRKLPMTLVRVSVQMVMSIVNGSFVKGHVHSDH
jgi:hypothetical protein